VPTRPPETDLPIVGDPYINDYATGAIVAMAVMLVVAAAALVMKRKINT